MNRDLWNIAISIIGIIAYISIRTANPGIAVFLISIFAGLLIFVSRFMVSNAEIAFDTYNADTAQRQSALQQAQIYLAPYKDIWRNLRLSNKYVSLILEKDGVTIRCIEKVHPYRRFKVVQSVLHTPQELWNMFCIYFSHNKSYDGILEDCYRYHVTTTERIGENSKNINQRNAIDINNSTATRQTVKPTKIDVNNCSEVELTELPGISIVIAKKIIKKQESLNLLNPTTQ